MVAGFTLIEVILAFALLALALTLLLSTLSGASRQVHDAADASRAALHAESLLATFDGGDLLAPGTQDGSFEQGRYRWRLEVQPFADPLKDPGSTPRSPGAPELLALDLEVRWGEGGPRQRLHVQSLRYVQPPQGGGP
jgi:general secretion pathway protein I